MARDLLPSKVSLAAILVFLLYPVYSQKQLWGYKTADPAEIFMSPLEGAGGPPATLHNFDPTGIEGTFPKDRIFQASNGKIYGIATSQGGQDIPNGVLFEYDPATDQYRALNNSIINGTDGNLYGLIEPVPGWLYGITNGGRSVFKYNIDTEEASIVGTIPPFFYQSGNMYPRFGGELMKASDGHLYGLTPMAPSSQNIPYPGGIYRINIATGQITKVYVFGTNGSDVLHPIPGSKLVEGAPGKLYGTSFGGSHIGPQGVAPLGSGTIFEFDIASAVLDKKYDFDYTTIGCNPSPVIKSGNKLYGTLFGYSASAGNFANEAGLLYEYDLTTETLAVLRIFDPSGNQINSPSGFLLHASDGNLYGGYAQGIYRYDPAADMLTHHTSAVTAYSLQSPIEVCRKPSYQPSATSSFIVCEGEPFSFDIQNTNAETYVWRKGTTVLPSQTTSVLNFDSTALSNSGIYTCSMTNECGSTITIPIQLTVDACMGVGENDALKGVTIYPNPVTDVLNIQLDSGISPVLQDITISTVTGQAVITGKPNTIDVSSLSSGLYLITITTDRVRVTQKFVKQ